MKRNRVFSLIGFVVLTASFAHAEVAAPPAPAAAQNQGAAANGFGANRFGQDPNAIAAQAGVAREQAALQEQIARARQDIAKMQADKAKQIKVKQQRIVEVEAIPNKAALEAVAAVQDDRTLGQAMATVIASSAALMKDQNGKLIADPTPAGLETAIANAQKSKEVLTVIQEQAALIPENKKDTEKDFRTQMDIFTANATNVATQKFQQQVDPAEINAVALTMAGFIPAMETPAAPAKAEEAAPAPKEHAVAEGEQMEEAAMLSIQQSLNQRTVPTETE